MRNVLRLVMIAEVRRHKFSGLLKDNSPHSFTTTKFEFEYRSDRTTVDVLPDTEFMFWLID